MFDDMFDDVLGGVVDGMFDPTRPDLQALGRRYCARCRAIRLAQAQISKYIEPTKQLPYWVNPATSVTTWTKPKIFGASDVEHAMMVATSRTEHLVRLAVFLAAATAAAAAAAVFIERCICPRHAFPSKHVPCCSSLEKLALFWRLVAMVPLGR